MKRTTTILLLLLLALGARAQTLPLLYNPTDPRSMAMGGAGVALDANAWAADANLAAAALSTQTFAAGVAYDYWAPTPLPDQRVAMGGWYRSGALAFGLSGRGSYARPTEGAGPAGEPLAGFAPYDLALALGAAWMAVPGLAFSASARIVSSALAENLTGTAFCADIALQYASGPVRAGIAAANLGGNIRFGEVATPLPALVRGGVTYTSLWADVTGEVTYLAQAGLMATAGVEARPLEQAGQPRSWLALRAAYHYGPADRGLPAFGSAGIGLYFSGLTIDLAVLFGSPTLGSSLSAGLSYSF